jgi:hypothetical protein
LATKGQVLLRDIFAMLDDCAPGWSMTKSLHHFRVTYQGRTYPSLPKGRHGKREGRGEIQKKQVKDLAEFFGILDCAKRHLEVLR